jgi:hypothetical protein
MSKDLPLPDKLKIQHGDEMGTIGPEAKQYYVPDKEAYEHNDIIVQRFDYRVKIGDSETGAFLYEIALDTTDDTYYIFIHTAGISPNDGFVTGLDYTVTISNGDRYEDENEIPKKVFETLQQYYD